MFTKFIYMIIAKKYIFKSGKVRPKHNSLHWIIFFSFCSFSYSGVYYNILKLSVSDIIVCQKKFQRIQKATIHWAELYFYSLSLRKDT